MSVAGAESFRFVQFDIPGRLGLDDGRYLLRAADGGEDETVVVVQTIGARQAARRSIRRPRPRDVEKGGQEPEVPLTRMTVISARRLSAADAGRELQTLRAERDSAEEAVADALREVNRLLRAQRVASQDPYGHEIGRLAPLAVRAGFGTGGELADGEWTEAVQIPAPERPRRRAETLRPQERLAELISGRESIDVCETLLLRARADIDHGRPREAALQLGAGLDALLAELPGRAGPGQEDDLRTLRERRDDIAAIARRALEGTVPDDDRGELAEVLRVCERVLRRRQALRD